MRDPVKEPRVGDVWVTPLGMVVITDPHGFCDKGQVGVRGLDGRWFGMRLWQMHKNGDAHPAVVIPLELAQTVYGTLHADTYYELASKLASYLPKEENHE